MTTILAIVIIVLACCLTVTIASIGNIADGSAKWWHPSVALFACTGIAFCIASVCYAVIWAVQTLGGHS